jgi:NADH dehydrogenase
MSCYSRTGKIPFGKHYSMMTPTFWLVPIRLFLGYSWLMEGIKKVQEGWLSKAMLAGLPADVGSSASVTESGETVFRIVSSHTPGWYAWIADNFVIPNAQLFQIFIVLGEIGLGLALISGTFTFLAGLGALALNINFILSTGCMIITGGILPAALCMLAAPAGIWS